MSDAAAAEAVLDPELLALRLKHPAFCGDWQHLRRFHALIQERRYYQSLMAAWNAWRSAADAPRLDLRGALARKGNLRDCDLRGADLRQAKLTEALLVRANLAKADLRGAALRGADLIGCDLAGADLRGADLRWARRATVEQLAAAIGDGTVILPEGLARPSNWV